MSLDGKKALSRIGLLSIALIWGTTFFLVKDTLRWIHPVAFVSLRFCIAAAVTFLILLVRGKNPWTGFSKGMWLGVFLWLVFTSQKYGLKYTSASNAGFITGLYVPLVPLFSLLLFNRRPALHHWAAILLSVSGLWILTGGVYGVNIGDVLTVATAVFAAFHILYSERFVRKDLDPWTLAFQQFFVVALLATAHTLVEHHPWPVWSGAIAWRMAYLVIFATIAAIIIQTAAQKYLDAVPVALILTLEPVFAAVFAWTLGGETFSFNQAVGGCVIIAAMVLSEVRNAFPEKNPTDF